MYYFPNLDNKTRLIMINEFERDIKNCLFYEPSSMKSEYVSSYKLLLRKYFEVGQIEGLEKALKPSFIKAKDKNCRKTPSNITQIIAFSDFNRYYVRAILIRAIDEGKSVSIYRAKQSLNERAESKALINKCYREKRTLEQMLRIIRDYRILFSSQSKITFLQPNSGLSLKLI
ncbi:TPA: hypothetical protein CPT90_05750 [Candidatus Gastranaerophilales bacterium HUM_3]|nr:MAG TPA: hypothetical protein CPT90_05750 [Candidatus Gastranaerophilales bacterium HUM_3]